MDERRGHKITIRLSEQEYMKLRSEAESKNLAVGTHIRSVACEGRRVKVSKKLLLPILEMEESLNELQLIWEENGEHACKEDVDDAFREINERMREICKRL